MIRKWRATSALAVIFSMATGCNDLTCGPGTKQVQDAKGSVQCVIADAPATGDVPCDVADGNASIVNGVCVSHVLCDPATARYDPVTGLCEGTGAAASACPRCPMTPGAGMTCISGRVIDFATGTVLPEGTRSLRIAAYDPLSFLNNPATAQPLSSTTDDHDCFTFTIPTPAAGIVAIGVDDPSGAAPQLALGAAGASILANTSYKVDAYLVPKSLLDGYAAANPAYATAGTYVGCYYSDPPPNPLDLTFGEKLPLAGVQLIENGSVPSPVGYLKLDRTIDATLTATGALGCAVTPGNGNIDQLTGKGGGVTRWETQPGGTAAATIFIARFHNCDGTAGNAFCQ